MPSPTEGAKLEEEEQGGEAVGGEGVRLKGEEASVPAGELSSDGVDSDASIACKADRLGPARWCHAPCPTRKDPVWDRPAMSCKVTRPLGKNR